MNLCHSQRCDRLAHIITESLYETWKWAEKKIKRSKPQVLPTLQLTHADTTNIGAAVIPLCGSPQVCRVIMRMPYYQRGYYGLIE